MAKFYTTYDAFGVEYLNSIDYSSIGIGADDNITYVTIDNNLGTSNFTGYVVPTPLDRENLSYSRTYTIYDNFSAAGVSNITITAYDYFGDPYVFAYNLSVRRPTAISADANYLPEEGVAVINGTITDEAGQPLTTNLALRSGMENLSVGTDGEGHFSASLPVLNDRISIVQVDFDGDTGHLPSSIYKSIGLAKLNLPDASAFSWLMPLLALFIGLKYMKDKRLINPAGFTETRKSGKMKNQRQTYV